MESKQNACTHLHARAPASRRSANRRRIRDGGGTIDAAGRQMTIATKAERSIGTAYDHSGITGDEGIGGTGGAATFGAAAFRAGCPVPRLFGEERNRTIASTGGGVRMSRLGNFSASPRSPSR